MTALPGHGRERGTTVPLVAVAIVTLFAIAALAIDIGILFTARTSAQHAADAGALAGAFTFTQPAAPQPQSAIDAAVSMANSNSILGQQVAITAGDVTVDLANRRVTVRVVRSGDNGIATYFARAVGRYQANIAVQATAEASQTATAGKCIKPVYIPNTIISPLSPAQACSSGQKIFDQSGNITPFAQGKMGQAYQIASSNPQDALQPSQFYALDFGSGANTYRCEWGQCLNACAVDATVVQCGSSYPLKTGAMTGPTAQGVRDLVGNPPDTWQGINQYQHSDGNIYDTSRSLVVAPVWDNCTQNISPGYHGQAVRVIGFIEMFVDGMQGNTVQAHMVAPIACSAGGGGNAFGANTGPYSVPIRLVTPPTN